MQSITDQISWLKLWKTHWNYRHWLICSGITSVLSFEFYNLFLSIYPNALINLYASWGIHSIFISSIISYAAILGLGLLSGWLLYSAHLTYLSLKATLKTLQPIIELWQFNTNGNEAFIQHLFQNENFIKLSEFLKDASIPLPFKDLLKNGDKSKEVQGVITLLCQLWSLKKPDEKIKQFTLNILENLNANEDIKPQIETISSLVELLAKASLINEEIFNKALDSHEAWKPKLTYFNRVGEDKDLLMNMIEHPEIAEFIVDYATIEGNHGHIQQFCQSLVCPQTAIDHWLKNHFSHDRAQYIQLWNAAFNQPFKDRLQTWIEYIDKQSDSENIFHDFNACLELLNAFNRLDIIASEQYPTIAANLDFLIQEQSLEFNQVLVLLNQLKLCNAVIIERIIAFKNIDEVLEILKSPTVHHGHDFLRLLDAADKIQQPSIVTPIEPRPVTINRPAPGFWSRFFTGLNCRSHIDIAPRPHG